MSQEAARLSLDCKATVYLGEFSRGGKTRGANQASDHDMDKQGKYTPCGILDEDTGELFIHFGSSYKTSDFIVDTLEFWWSSITPEAQQELPMIQLKIDNGPESSGSRTQFLKRIVDWVDRIGKPVYLLYFPPYHSKYNPIERCWGILEQHWNGALLTDVQTMLAWAESMTWKGLHPILELSQTVYQKGISVAKSEMSKIEQRLQRDLILPKWGILIQPI